MKKYSIIIFITLHFIVVVSSNAQQNDWKNLFDGKTLNGWMRLAGTANFTVDNGEIVGTTVLNSPNTFLATEKEYGDLFLSLM